MTTLFFLTIAALVRQAADKVPTWVGTEQTVTIVITGTTLAARKQFVFGRSHIGPSDSSVPPLVVLAVNPLPDKPGGYEIRCIGLRAGDHDLRDYLEFSDGVTRQMISPMTVRIVDPLPPSHRGVLESPPILLRELDLPGLDPSTAFAIAGLWGLGLGAIVVSWWRKTHRRRTQVAETIPDDDLSRRLCLAERKLMTPQGLAELELLLLERWRSELNLKSVRFSALMPALESHPRGRELCVAFDLWRRRLEAGPAEIPPLLKAYSQPSLAPAASSDDVSPGTPRI